MNRETQDTVLLFVGVMVLQVGLTDLHLRYVKPQMQPLLVGAGVILTVLAVVSIVRLQRASRAASAKAKAAALPEGAAVAGSARERTLLMSGAPGGDVTGLDDPRDGVMPDEADDGHGHGAHHMPRTAWLLALPLLVLALITPPSLGAYAAARGDTAIDKPQVTLPDLAAPRDGAVDLTLTEYATRALYAADSVDGQPVRLTGFVVPQDGGWAVARMKLSCCAADGRPVKIAVAGQDQPPENTWVEVVGTFAGQGDGGASTVSVAAEQLRVIEAPTQQYE